MPHARPARAGSSVIQTLALLLALSVGVWVGARQMGLNLGHVAYTALDEASLLEKVPEEWRPDPGAGPFVDGDSDRPANQISGKLAHELADLRQEVQRLRAAGAQGGGVLAPTPEDNPQQARRRERTLAYWSRLCETAQQVSRLQRDLAPAMKRGTTGHVFDLRRRLMGYGRRSVQDIPTAGVDPLAVEAGARLAAWYVEGEQFYAGAVATWDSLAGASGGGADRGHEAIERSRRQFHKQTDLLRAKLGELSSKLSRHYEAPLPVVGV